METIKLNQIYNESNLETMAKMPDCFIDLTITSPPYDNLREYNGFSFEFEKIANELFRVTKIGGVLVWVVGDATIDGCESLTSFKQAIYFVEKCGFNLHDTMIYQKETLPLSHKRYEQHFEYMFVFVKGTIKTFNGLKERTINIGSKNTFTNKSKTTTEKNSKRGNKDGKKFVSNEYKLRNNIWKYNVGSSSSVDKIAFQHPAIFPERLVEEHILSWSNENDLVYDCFGGSGTTAKMCHKWKRNWILSEISSEYVDIANKRLKPYLEQTTLF
jgi:DNA modification methylase